MDVFRWKDVRYLIENIIDKLVSLRIPGTEDIGKHAPRLSHFVRSTSTSELWISSQCAQHVTGHIDLRNHCYVAVGGVLYYLTHIFLRIKTTVRNTIIKPCVASNYRLRTL